VPYSNLLKLVAFLLCLPVTDAPTVWVFFMNSLWTIEKTQQSVETLKVLLVNRANSSSLMWIFSNCCVVKKHLEEDEYLLNISVTWAFGQPVWA
jgi:hypothetical protein